MKTSLTILLNCILIFAILLEYVATAPQWRVASDGNKYLIESENKYNWFEAYDQCARRGLHLVVIENAKKNEALVKLMKSIIKKGKWWMGYYDELNTVSNPGRAFYSVETGNRISFNYWSPGEPNNYKNNEHCAHISLDFKWNDLRCEKELGYICQEQQKLKEIRQKTNDINNELSKDFKNNQNNIKEIFNNTQTANYKVLEELKQATNEIIFNMKKSIDDVIRQNPYLEVVKDDVGPAFKDIHMEAYRAIIAAASKTKQALEENRINSLESVKNIESEFGNKLDKNTKTIDALFVV